MAKDFESLKQQALVIKNEVEDGANSSERIGGILEDILDYNNEKLTALGNKLNKLVFTNNSLLNEHIIDLQLDTSNYTGEKDISKLYITVFGIDPEGYRVLRISTKPNYSDKESEVLVYYVKNTDKHIEYEQNGIKLKLVLLKWYQSSNVYVCDDESSLLTELAYVKNKDINSYRIDDINLGNFILEGNNSNIANLKNVYVDAKANTTYEHPSFKTYFVEYAATNIKKLNIKIKPSTDGNIYYVAFYNEKMQIIGGIKNDNNQEEITEEDLSYPEHCAFVSFSWDSAYSASNIYIEGEYNVTKSGLDIYNRIYSKEFYLNGQEDNFITRKINQYYDTASNVFFEHPTWKTYLFDTNFIIIKSFSITYTVGPGNVAIVLFLDEHSKAISYIDNSKEGGVLTNEDISIPKGTRYIGLSWEKGTIEVIGDYSLGKEKNIVEISPEIVYDGDSITSGTFGNYAKEAFLLMKDEFPELQYKNYGMHSGTSENIAALNGATPITIKSDITIPSNGEIEITLSHNVHNQFGQVIGNPYTIRGIQGNLIWKGGTSGDFSNQNYTFSRLNEGKEKKIKSGEIVISDAISHNVNSHILSIFIGTNNTLSDTATLDKIIDLNKRMAMLSKNGHYIVLTPYIEKLNYEYYFPKMNDLFGNKLIDLYTYFREYGVQDAVDLGYITESDAQSHTWEQLLLDGGIDSEVAGIHPSQTGYKLIGLLVYQRCKDLGYLQSRITR